MIADFDDDSEKSAEQKLTAGLGKLGIRYFCFSLKLSEYKNRNENFVKYRQKFSDKAKKIPKTIEKLKKNSHHNLSDSVKVASWDMSIVNAHEAIPTGWKNLDKVLEDRL